jgi:hypothetical protein
MPPELQQLLDATPPANLADLIALRTRALDRTPPPEALGEPWLAAAWERWRNGVMQLAAHFAAHHCRGPGCGKCAEYYALAQVLAAKQRHLVATRRAKRVRWLRSRWPQGEA